MSNKLKYKILGLVAGLFNGMFGAGGGKIVVPMLEKLGIDPKKAHATSIVIIGILSIFSLIGYSVSGHIDFQNTLGYIPTGIVGVFVGSWLLKKIEINFLRRIFGLIMIISSIGLFLK